MKLPDNVEVQLQTLWESAGWATPATLGACVANPNSRVILITDAKSHQISVMEIGTMLKLGYKPIILVLNNKKYSSESDIQYVNLDNRVNYSKIARIFEGNVWTAQVRTQDDLDKALKVTKILDKLCYIEICIDEFDLPKLTIDMLNDFRKAKAVNDTGNAIIEDEKVVKKRLDLRTCLSVNFATKVHESLKKED